MVALKRVKFSSNRKETFGFKTSEIPAPVPELKEFEGKLFDLVKSVEFRAISNTFQDELNNNIRNIQNETRLILPADKTTNFRKKKYSFTHLSPSYITKARLGRRKGSRHLTSAWAALTGLRSAT